VTVAPDVYACLQPEGGLGASNSGFIDRAGGLVVDSFWDLPRTRALIRHYSTVNPTPPRRLVNTHHNGDHCWGNQLFAEAGTEIIGHRRCAEYFGRESPQLLQSLRDSDTLAPSFEAFAQALRRFDFRGIELTPPTKLIDDDTLVELGDTAVQLLSVGPAHTAGDVAVFLPDEGVLFTGDILFNKCTPIGWEGTFANWIAALERLAALEPAVVIPGHGPVGNTDDLLALHDYLIYVYDEAESHFDAGHSILEAAKAIDIGPWLAWEEPERLAFQIHRAYREFSGAAWDEPVDIAAVLNDLDELRRHFGNVA
ncbi:MAG: MBL fold metallo-hydrolase, partial [Acidimicrobiales bacterium]|nr:MBL fold metallo-hydrolase [Acidimicrobiales bacterium]